MIEIETAWELIQQATQTNPTEQVQIPNAVGRIASSPLTADLDSPPFDKSLMDGYAVSEMDPEQTEFRIIEKLTAGQVATKEISQGQASQIMTGCPIPAGAQGVVMVEQTEQIDEQSVRINAIDFKPGQNVLRRGTVIRAGESILEKGHLLRPHHVGALSEFGFTTIDVFRRSSVAVLATGDELVPPEEKPGPGQIRNSNGILLKELAKAAGADVIDLGIGRDNQTSLNQKIQEGLRSDVLVIAGGVSAGVLDLIPQCLADNGVEKIFHKINLKPGKPLWFGKTKQEKLVFGLPGNPISSLVCFKLFVEPTIRRAAGQRGWIDFELGKLVSDFKFKGGRRTFWPSEAVRENGDCHLQPLAWKGSADQVTYLQANSLLALGSESNELSAGEPVRFIKL